MSLSHDNAHTHVTGESEYIDDRPLMANEVFVEVVFSTRAHAKILTIDTSKILEDSHILGVFTAKDFHHNLWGTIFKDQPLLAPDLVQYAGEPILLIASTNRESAQYAKQKIIIEYEDLPNILSISEAIEKKSFIGPLRSIIKGDVDQVFKTATHQIEDKIIIQGADHFYLESQATIVYPLEDGQLEVHSSTQHPTETQHVVAHSLGLNAKDVVCQAKRMGGGFGGKESQAAHFAALCALVAYKLKRPARLCLTKDDDMMMTGKRNPFENFYKVAFDDQGKIQALEVKLFSDAGAYADLSTSIMERAMLHCDNAYYLPNAKIQGQVCKTNHHSNTAFRGFGGPKGVATIEIIIEKIAHYLKKDALEIRKLNCYQIETNNETHFGQKVENNCLPQLFSDLEIKCEYQKRKSEILKFNQTSNEFIKGISLTAVKFGISFTTRFLNQANALVIIHNDGSLQISTGATEMGQGVNARIAEMVTSELSLPRSTARVMPTRTDKNANTSPTAASSGTDLNGAAALLATRKIKNRLSELATLLFKIPSDIWPSKTAGIGNQAELKLQSPLLDTMDPNLGAQFNEGVAHYHGVIFKDQWVYDLKNPDYKISFNDLVREAYYSRISLSDYAFYRIEGLDFDKLAGKGNAFLYFTQGVACSEVMINRDSGETKVLRTDILMDLGRPVNRDLDVGQIAGAFVQGLGWVSTENLFYSDQGLLLSHAPSSYKIPNIQDTPREFNIELINNNSNFKNVRGTKAVGEPPLLLALSAWCAVNQALASQPTYHNSYPSLKIPATNENVLRSLYPDYFSQSHV